MSEYAIHFKSQLDCGSVVSITWCGIGNGSSVAGCFWLGDGTCCGIGWGWVVGWGGDKRWDMSYTAQTHIHHN